MFPPASFPWLLAQELRVLWRGSILVRTHKYVLIPALLVGLGFQAIALILAAQIVEHPLPRPEMLLIADLNLVFLFTLMLARALTAAIDVLYGRGDVDFLLASPIQPGRVLAARMLGVALSIAAPWMLLGGALANGLAAFGQPWALAIYPVLLATALVAAALAFAIGIALIGWIGPGPARRAGHLLALFVGLFIFILGQAPRLFSPATVAGFWRALLPRDDAGIKNLLAHALLGDPAGLAASLACSLAIFLAVWAGSKNRFGSGAIAASAYRPPGRASRQDATFRASQARAIVMKNLRLLVRFPGIVSQTTYRALALIPVLMILAGWRAAQDTIAVPPLLVFLAGQLGLFFISILVATDQAPDLAASAPLAANAARTGAFTAASYATLLIMAPPSAALALTHPNLLPATTIFATLALAANLALGARMPIPLTRASFGKTQTGTTLGLIIGVALSTICALTCWFTISPHPLAWLYPAS